MLNRSLRVVMYHYVRDRESSRFPRIKACTTDTFRNHVVELKKRYQIATLEEALAFLAGTFVPQRDLCLLTFDDGLKDHYRDVMPILVEHGLSAQFFISTSCLDGHVASVHKNHFLMAGLDFDTYRSAILDRLQELSPGTSAESPADVVRTTYRWDTAEVAAVKYLVNFQLAPELRDAIFASLFEEHFGDEQEFARDLYLSWDEVREMQQAGATIGGHAHDHVAMATVGATRAREEAATCYRRLHEMAGHQSVWPFCYPYGSYNDDTRGAVMQAGFVCSFTTEDGDNATGVDRFAIRRTDANDALRP